MKKLVLILFGFMLSFGVNAQSGTDQARTEADRLTAVYGLDAKQQKKMYEIQQLKVKNLSEIEALKTENPELYAVKRHNTVEGEEASIRMMLNAEQVKILDKSIMDRRIARANRMSELRKQGLTMEDVNKKLLEEGF